jgi:hypothetical protein
MEGRQTALDDVRAMFSEIARVLKPGGLYALLSLAEAHVMQDILRFPAGAADVPTCRGVTPWPIDVVMLDHESNPSSLCPGLFMAAKPVAGEVGAVDADDDRYVRVRQQAGNWLAMSSKRAVLAIREAQWLFNVRVKARRVEKGSTFTLDLGEPEASASAAAAYVINCFLCA